jgi:glucose/arabinose dehydrogenase
VDRRRARAASWLLVALVIACTPSSTPGPSTSASGPTPAVSPSSGSTPTTGSTPTAEVALEIVAENLVAPVALVAAPDDPARSFLVDQTGTILVLRDGRLLDEPFLDLRAHVVPLDRDYDERGLLGLALHPEFATDRRLFVYYGAPLRPGAAVDQDHTNVLSEFRVLPDDPDRVDPASERRILEFEQPQPNHSGGALGFGPDGLLYLGTGDGGGRGDADAGHSPQGNAQDPDKLNGKILRIDVDRTSPPEIHALGFRNPWRLAWEPEGARRLLVSDVGYGRYEEVDAVVAGGNYGWRIREGAHCLDIAAPLEETTGCPTTDERGEPLIDPVIEYSHREVGIAVVGGHVYRGTDLPALAGRYVFADYSADWTTPQPRPSGSLLVAEPRPDSSPWDWRRLSIAQDPLTNRFVTGMGEDAAGELYVMTRQQSGPIGLTGRAYRIVATR